MVTGPNDPRVVAPRQAEPHARSRTLVERRRRPGGTVSIDDPAVHRSVAMDVGHAASGFMFAAELRAELVRSGPLG